MKVVADKYIPYLQGVLEPHVEVQYLDPADIAAAAVRDADALLIRTRTRCDAALLSGAKVQFIGTATIGLDHIDIAYCRQAGITYTNAPGCNAAGVADYVLQVINIAINSRSVRHLPPVVGIIGVGHVGSLVAEIMHRRSYKVLLYDPLLPAERVQELSRYGTFVPLEELRAEADIITVHTPLTLDGDYPTYHLIDRDFLQHCDRCGLIINAARGGIVDEAEAVKWKYRRLKYAIDTWEGEPNINPRMLRRTIIGTPHIAGYTQQGKLNATQMVLNALAQHFHLPALRANCKQTHFPPPENYYWLLEDDRRLRENSAEFELQRQHYKLR